MPGASRLGDTSYCGSDSHGNLCCPHSVSGPAVSASGNVLINGRGALRQGDSGVHSACCGPNTWNTTACSRTVFINGKGAVRQGDMTQHCGGTGSMQTGSQNVIIGG